MGVTDENNVKKIVFPNGIVEAFGEQSFYTEKKDGNTPAINDRITNTEVIEGLPFESLEHVLYYKQKMNREKDKQDIEIIETLINEKKSSDHWVSQFLLKFFVQDGQVWIYDKTTKQRTRRPIKAICCEEGFTTFSPDEIPQGIKSLKNGKFLETELSKWEDKQSRTIKKLIKNRTIEAILVEEFWELTRFSIWLYLCNPAHRAMLRQGWSELHLLNIRSLTEDDLDALSLKIFGLFLPYDYFRKQLEIAAAKEELLQSEFLALALKSADSIFDLVVNEYAWSLADCKSLGAGFCTSDRPVLLGGQTLSDPVGFNTPGVTLFFPLSPDLCLTGKNVGKSKRFVQNNHIITNPAFLGMPTLLTWAKSNQYIIAAEKERLPISGMDLPSYTPTILKKKKNIGFLHK